MSPPTRLALMYALRNRRFTGRGRAHTVATVILMMVVVGAKAGEGTRALL